jgi:hypothetical protein
MALILFAVLKNEFYFAGADKTPAHVKEKKLICKERCKYNP